jgi:hypothetical protein
VSEDESGVDIADDAARFNELGGVAVTASRGIELGASASAGDLLVSATPESSEGDRRGDREGRRDKGDAEDDEEEQEGVDAAAALLGGGQEGGRD